MIIICELTIRFYIYVFLMLSTMRAFAVLQRMSHHIFSGAPLRSYYAPMTTILSSQYQSIENSNALRMSSRAFRRVERREPSLYSPLPENLQVKGRIVSSSIKSPETDGENDYDAVDNDVLSKCGFKRGMEVWIRVEKFGVLGATVSVVPVLLSHEDSSEDPFYDRSLPNESGLLLQKEIAGYRAKHNGRDVRLGDILKGWVSRVSIAEPASNKKHQRTREVNIDVSLKRLGKNRIEDNAQFILELLRQSHDKKLYVGDKSSPEEVISALRHTMGKTDFKNAVGALYRQGLVQPGPSEVCLMSETERDALLNSPKHAITAKFIASKQQDNQTETAPVTTRKRIWPMYIGNLPPKITATNLINFLIKVLKEKYSSDELVNTLDRELCDEELSKEILCIRGRHEVFRPNEENADGKTLFNDFVFVDLATEVARDTLVASLPGLRWFGKKLKADNGVLKKNKGEEKGKEKETKKEKEEGEITKIAKKNVSDDIDNKNDIDDIISDKKESVLSRNKEHFIQEPSTQRDVVHTPLMKHKQTNDNINLNDNNDSVNNDINNNIINNNINNANSNTNTNNINQSNNIQNPKINKIDNLVDIDEFFFSGDEGDTYDTEKDRATHARSKNTGVDKTLSSQKNLSSKSSHISSNGGKGQMSSPSKNVTLFVGNLSFDTDSDDLAQFARDTLSQTTIAVTVSNSRIVTDRFSGRKRGFGYIDLCLDDAVDIDRVLMPLFQNSILQGRQLRIDVADEHHSR